MTSYSHLDDVLKGCMGKDMARNSCCDTFCVGAVTRHFRVWNSISVEVRKCDCTLSWLGKHVALSVGAAAEKLQGIKQNPVRPLWHRIFSILDLYLGRVVECHGAFRFFILTW